MSRNPEYQFVSMDGNELLSTLIASYEKIVGVPVRPASPERIFIAWMANIFLQMRALINRAANRNLPSRATGTDLDAIADLYYLKSRPTAAAATSTMRCFISQAQSRDILIPSGTRFTDYNSRLYWASSTDAYVKTGQIYADVPVICQTMGSDGNGFEPGQINKIVDPYDYFDRCANVTTSANGADTMSDDDFYARLRASQDAYSVAGPPGAYSYHAKSVNSHIEDVAVISHTAGQVTIYAMMDDGTPAGTEVKKAIEAALGRDVRPLTDQVAVSDPETVTYNIDLTYYIPTDSAISAVDMEASVQDAVSRYQSWQSARMGRDINPAMLISMVMQTGVKRVVVRSPEYAELSSGSTESAPQLASIGTINVVNGGYEDE